MPSAVLRTCAAVASVCLAAAVANSRQNETADPRIWLAVEEQPRGQLRIEPIAAVNDGQLTPIQSRCLSDALVSQDPAADFLKPGQSYSLLFGGANIRDGLITEENKSEGIAYLKYGGNAKIRGQVRALATNIQQSGFRVALRETASAEDRRSALALAREIFSAHGVPEAYLPKVRAEYLTRTYLAPSPQASLVGSFYLDTENDEGLLHALFFIAGESSDKLQPELTWIHISENESDEERMRLVDHADLLGNGQDDVVTKLVSVQTQSHRYVIFRRPRTPRIGSSSSRQNRLDAAREKEKSQGANQKTFLQNFPLTVSFPSKVRCARMLRTFGEELPVAASSVTRVIQETHLGTLKPVARGKVRDIYDLGDQLLIVATDRLSAFDVILPTPIPDKGRVLTQISLFWFDLLKDVIPNHVLSATDFPGPFDAFRDDLAGRSMIVRKTQPLPIECVVRGYVSGSGWKDYKATGRICGIDLPAGLRESDRLPEPIFTPATKAATGHDENISFARAAELVGENLAERVREISLEIYRRAAAYAEPRGVILADTKFEFGLLGATLGSANAPDSLMWIDEALTPDSSRFWPAAQYQPGGPQPSFDKQFVRDYLEQIRWPKTPPGPELPPEVVAATRAKYRDAYRILAGRDLDDQR